MVTLEEQDRSSPDAQAFFHQLGASDPSLLKIQATSAGASGPPSNSMAGPQLFKVVICNVVASHIHLISVEKLLLRAQGQHAQLEAGNPCLQQYASKPWEGAHEREIQTSYWQCACPRPRPRG